MTTRTAELRPASAAVYRRRRVTVFGLGALVLAALVYLPVTLLAPVGSVAASIEAPPLPASAAVAPAWPAYGAGAVGAVGWDGVLTSYGTADPVPIASITKVITALVVLDAKPIEGDGPGESVTMGRADLDHYTAALRDNATVLPVRAGLVFTERELLELSLIESAANYTMSLAAWAYGSLDAYVPAANAWLAAQGLTGTAVADSTGLDPRSSSTTADLIALGKLALANPVVAAVVGTETTQLHDLGELDNLNALVGHGGVTGIKTGTLPQAGACLLFSVEREIGDETVTIIGVVLSGAGQMDHKLLNADIRGLIDTVTDGFHEVQLTTAGEPFAAYTTAWGDTADAVAASAEDVLVWSDTAVTSEVRTERIGVTAKGTRVGSVVFTAGARTVTVPLELSRDIRDPGPLWRITNPGASGG